MITAWIPLCLGAALACWPDTPDRLRAAIERPPSRPARRTPARSVCWLLPAALAGVFGGVGGAIAVGVLTLAWRQESRSHHRAARELKSAEHTATALRTMVAELRAGAHPATAAEAAADAVPEVSGELRALATAAQLDGELSSPVLPELAAAWTLSRRHGLPMVEVLDAASRDVEAGLVFRRRLRAKLADPRTSAVVLTALPVLCLLLGQVVGAGPLPVLTGTAAGQFLLVAGSVLLWAGTAWCRALTVQVRPR